MLSMVTAWSCSGRRERPALPAPEYERHDVAPYDAGTPADPLDDDAGDWLDYEDEEGEPVKPAPAKPAASGGGAATDAGAQDADASAGDAGGGP
ncbi:MAG: hypothetical protein R3B07_25005 [Polyangiaceae bacterium]